MEVSPIIWKSLFIYTKMEFVYTAFALGALGSFHCVGMCGPIALALPFPGKASSQRLLGSLLYNLGRIFTYGCMGAIFGLLGQSFALAGIQQSLSVGLGVAIILAVLLPPALFRRLNPNTKLAGIIARVKQQMQHLFGMRTYPSMFMIGSLNGLLPCGLVYLGLAGATASASMSAGAVYMLLFGLGTWPVMLLTTFFGQWINLSLRNRIRSAMPYVVACMGIVFILRGMSLDIPYLSPKLIKDQQAGIPICH